MSFSRAIVSDALNSMWRINVSGQVYGPYTGHQIKSFAEEGRLAPHSIVQAGDQGPWITAIDDPVLGQLFAQETKPLPAAKPIAQPAAGAVAETANFVVIADLKARGSGHFEATLNKLGDNYRLSSTVWIVHTDRTAGGLRNELVPHLGNTDALVIIDATRGKSAWFNLGPEADAKIRRVWKRSGDKA